jgi:hypothetical protein
MAQACRIQPRGKFFDCTCERTLRAVRGPVLILHLVVYRGDDAVAIFVGEPVGHVRVVQALSTCLGAVFLCQLS